MPLLADKYRVIAPDLPGFGFTEVPSGYVYTFDNLASTIEAFTRALNLTRYALYIFDYGAPTGLRLAMAHPEHVTAIISQNGNAYEEGLGDAWAPIQRYWSEPTEANRDVVRQHLNLEGLKSEYTPASPIRAHQARGLLPSTQRSSWTALATPKSSSTSILDYAENNLDLYPRLPGTSSAPVPTLPPSSSGASTTPSSSRPEPKPSNATTPPPSCSS